MVPLFLWSLHAALVTEKQAKPPQESRARGHLCQAVQREHWWEGDRARSPTPQLEGAQGSWLLGRLPWPGAGSGSGLNQTWQTTWGQPGR